MYKTSEIYLTKNYVSKKEWEDLINIISNYFRIINKKSVLFVSFLYLIFIFL